MDTGTIEREAVRVVSGYVDRCPQLTSDIHFNDSGALLDGNIKIYKDD